MLWDLRMAEGQLQASSKALFGHHRNNRPRRNLSGGLAGACGGNIEHEILAQDACNKEDRDLGPGLLQKACKNALSVLVANSVHSKAPRCVKKGSQLYVVHGVVRGGFDVLLLYGLRDSFAQLKTRLLRFGADLEGMRILVDYERLAIAAIRTTDLRATSLVKKPQRKPLNGGTPSKA
ncbi:unnamed protein product [Cylicostephanus goldi]|uniref:Uncharacterized protein n=1 Tax=Cylicostephanus goldi TaxID=71465 RepID=A0A3P6T0R9_CYLGO|nr:unnamed protein product [Cylicostephanus goldi]